ncbi:unnamed protein product, partial [Mycena citricolor]
SAPSLSRPSRHPLKPRLPWSSLPGDAPRFPAFSPKSSGPSMIPLLRLCPGSLFRILFSRSVSLPRTP